MHTRTLHLYIVFFFHSLCMQKKDCIHNDYTRTVDMEYPDIIKQIYQPFYYIRNQKLWKTNMLKINIES